MNKSLSFLLWAAMVLVVASCTAVNVSVLDRLESATRHLEDLQLKQTQTAEEEIRWLKLLAAAHDRQAVNEANLLVQQQANIEAAKKVGKSLKENNE